mmetsp:Transcript_5281/g.15628  ORF Transcript_5281/g.15628 Transcript_5281/m.15628 type:complete len:544 (+) Transcript_5281:838-2469(+)
MPRCTDRLQPPQRNRGRCGRPSPRRLGATQVWGLWQGLGRHLERRDGGRRGRVPAGRAPAGAGGDQLAWVEGRVQLLGRRVQRVQLAADLLRFGQGRQRLDFWLGVRLGGLRAAAAGRPGGADCALVRRRGRDRLPPQDAPRPAPGTPGALGVLRLQPPRRVGHGVPEGGGAPGGDGRPRRPGARRLGVREEGALHEARGRRAAEQGPGQELRARHSGELRFHPRGRVPSAPAASASGRPSGGGGRRPADVRGEGGPGRAGGLPQAARGPRAGAGPQAAHPRVRRRGRDPRGDASARELRGRAGARLRGARQPGRAGRGPVQPAPAGDRRRAQGGQEHDRARAERRGAGDGLLGPSGVRHHERGQAGDPAQQGRRASPPRDAGPPRGRRRPGARLHGPGVPGVRRGLQKADRAGRRRRRRSEVHAEPARRHRGAGGGLPCPAELCLLERASAADPGVEGRRRDPPGHEDSLPIGLPPGDGARRVAHPQARTGPVGGGRRAGAGPRGGGAPQRLRQPAREGLQARRAHGGGRRRGQGAARRVQS